MAIKFNQIVSILLFLNATGQVLSQNTTDLTGAWQSEEGVCLFSGKYFSCSLFNTTDRSFSGTYGGTWNLEGNHLNVSYEFNSQDPQMAGKTKTISIVVDPEAIWLDGKQFHNLDRGKPGDLEGAWLFGGRVQNDVLASRDTSEARKTMKILSGTRFQWIAYHTQTGEFFGTGGGIYTTQNKKYTEKIDFFPRDTSRIGANLEFDYEIKMNEWNHRGFSSRGDPLYEIWIRRK